MPHVSHVRGGVEDLADDMQPAILRLGALERHSAGEHVLEVNQNAEIDLLKTGVEGIERRLELIVTADPAVAPGPSHRI